MKQFRLALVLLISALGFLRAQDEQNRQPPTEIPDFSNLDEYIYEPKSTLIVGMRLLSGVKAQFSGQGMLAAPETPTDATTPNIIRNYHDGSVSVDGRGGTRVDNGNNPLTDANGASTFDPISSDGKTNTWQYNDPTQLTANGLIAFHTYAADITDPAIRNKQGSSAGGIDVAVSRDMGKLFGTRASWSLIAGVTMNDISSKISANVQATLTTITDLYSLDGQVVPVVVLGTPYISPSSTPSTVLDSGGNPVLAPDGSVQTTTLDTSVLLNNKPINRTTTTAVDTTSVTDLWKLKGSYFTFRAGPALWLPISSRFRASVSAGPTLIYAGSTYSVTQTYQPITGNAITDISSDTASHLLPGYFADASVEFDLTERTGFFAGMVYQSAGSYQQVLNTTSTVNATAEHYATNVNFGNQNGLRAGMTIRF